MLAGAQSQFVGAVLGHFRASGYLANADEMGNDSEVMAGSLLGHDFAVVLPGFYSFYKPL